MNPGVHDLGANLPMILRFIFLYSLPVDEIATLLGRKHQAMVFKGAGSVKLDQFQQEPAEVATPMSRLFMARPWPIHDRPIIRNWAADSKIVDQIVDRS